MLIIGVAIGWIHVMAAAIAMGGSYFLNFIVEKAAKEMPPAEGGKLKGTLGPLFGKVSAMMMFLLIVTGVMRAGAMGALNPSILFGEPYGYMLLGKIVVATIIMVNIAVLARNGAKAEALAAADGAPDMTSIAAIGKQQKMLGTATFVLGAVAIAFAVAMRFLNESTF